MFKRLNHNKYTTIQLYEKMYYKFVSIYKENSIEVINSLAETTEEIQMIKVKILYSLSRFKECEETAKFVLSMNSENYDAHYLIAASLVSRNFLVSFILYLVKH